MAAQTLARPVRKCLHRQPELGGLLRARERIFSEHIALLHTKRLAATSAAELMEQRESKVVTTEAGYNRRIDTLDMGFKNHYAAYKSKTTWEVLRAYIVLQLCSKSWIVMNNEELMKLGQRILGKPLFAKLMKLTFYGHFVAGENRQNIKPIIHRMHTFGVKSILDYSVEEDISDAQARQREMEACNVDEQFQPENIPLKGTHQDSIRRYQAHVNINRRFKVSSARTYFYQNEAQCEKNMETFLRCIEAVADSTQATGLAAIKMTALGRPNLLLQLSECIIRARRYYELVSGKEGFIQEGDFGPNAFRNRFKENQILDGNPEVQKWLSNMTVDKKGLVHLFSWSGLINTNLLMKDVFKVPNLKTGKMEPLISALSEKEEEQFRNMLTRLRTIFQAAKDLDVRVMVDAEQTYFQPAISRLTMEMMRTYNTEKAIIFNTYQCYLKIAYQSLWLDMEQAERQNFFFGAKLVRGAYMEQEKARAIEVGYEDPINPSYEATSAMYEKCLEACMQKMKENKKGEVKDYQRVGIMVASHNSDTIRLAIEKMKEYNINPGDRMICFGQLYGMCDQLSFPLGQAGYSVYKYVPYGPVNDVLPYLSRRARENKGILHKLQLEKSLLASELISRLKTGKIFYKPKGDYLPVGFEDLPPSLKEISGQ